MEDEEKSHRLKALLAKAKTLAIEYYNLTLKPLGITGEIAEYEAAEKLGLTLSVARTERVDAYQEVDGKRISYQIKGRAIPRHDAHRHRVPAILDGEFDFVILVLLDRINLEPFEIWQAERCAVMAKLDGLEGNSARLRRSMAISQYRSIPATLVWSADDEKPSADTLQMHSCSS